MLGDVIFLHHHSNLSERAGDGEVRAHRISYLALASFAVQYLECLLPPQKVRVYTETELTSEVLLRPMLFTLFSSGNRRFNRRFQSGSDAFGARRESDAQLW